MSATAIAAVGAMAGTAINAYQRHQEKKRQERIDKYNQELNERNFRANQMMNSSAYQMQNMKDAGINPLASGITPEFNTPSANTSPLSPQPIPQPSNPGLVMQ